MKKLWMILVFFIAQGAMGASIKSLANGSCWLQEQTDGIRLVDFNHNEIHQLNRYQILKEMLEMMPLFVTKGDATLLNFGVHCGSYGVSYIARIEENGTKYCQWFRRKKGSFTPSSFGLIEEDEGQLCHGVVHDELVITTERSVTVDHIKNELSDDLDGARKVVEGVFVLKFKPTVSRFDSKEILRLFKDELKIKTIGANSISHPIGEYRRLNLYKESLPITHFVNRFTP